MPRAPFDDDDFDRDFPLGDGTADTTAFVQCPACGEQAAITLDPGGGSLQEYAEDCPVCCRPWQVTVRYQPDGRASVSVSPE